MSNRDVIECEVLMAQMTNDAGLFRAVHRWLRAHGVDPTEVPVPSEMVIEDSAFGRVIRYDVYLRDETGGRYVDPGAGDPYWIARARRAALLQLAPPSEWLSTSDGDS